MRWRLLGSLLVLMLTALTGNAVGFSSVTLSGHTHSVHALAFSPDGLLLASADAQTSQILIWDVARHEIILRLEGHRAPVTSLAFSPDGLLISASQDETIKIWDPTTGTLLRQLLGHHGPVYDAQVSPDGRQIASVSGDRSLRLWDAQTGREIASRTLEEALFSVAFGAQGDWVVTGDEAGQIRMWEIPSLQEVGSVEAHGEPVWALDVHPEGKLLASGGWDGVVNLWQIDPSGTLEPSPQTLAQFDTWVLSLAFSPDGRLLAVGLLDWGKNDTLYLFDVATGQPLHAFDRRSRYALTFSPNRTELAIAGETEGTITLLHSSARGPALISPAPEEVVDPLEAVSLRWEAVPDVVYYEVEVAQDPEFRQLLYHQIGVAPSQTFSLDGETMEADQSYWWRVRSSAFGSQGKWSPPRRFLRSPALSCQLEFVPATLTLERGQIADVVLRVTAVSHLTRFDLSLAYDPNILFIMRLSEAEDGFDLRDSRLTADIDNIQGTVRRLQADYSGEEGFTGSGDLVRLTIRALEPGDTTITLTQGELVDTQQQPLSCAFQSAFIRVQDPVNPWDVNRDGVVNVLDFVVIGQAFGQPVVGNPEINPDVNRDGIVDVLDFALVAQHFGERFTEASVAAPPLSASERSMLDRGLRGIPFPSGNEQLDRVIVSLRRALQGQNRLAQNFPNPCNPETWIPYELAQDADVWVRIYDARGRLIREIHAGVRQAGSYLSQERAIYWDGTDRSGEPVPSGVYFYTLSAGNFTATRKMTVVR